LLWALAREVRLLADLKRDIIGGIAAVSALNQRGVWRSRQPLVQKALNRLTGSDLAQLQALSFQTDGASKGFLPGIAWDALERLVVIMAQGAPAAKTTVRRA
jgi:DNA polymerase-3 subunit delta